MKTTIRDQYNKQRSSIYNEAVKRFKTSYTYVWQIAIGTRSGSKGKGAQIKKYLEDEIKKRQSMGSKTTSKKTQKAHN